MITGTRKRQGERSKTKGENIVKGRGEYCQRERRILSKGENSVTVSIIIISDFIIEARLLKLLLLDELE